MKITKIINIKWKKIVLLYFLFITSFRNISKNIILWSFILNFPQKIIDFHFDMDSYMELLSATLTTYDTEKLNKLLIFNQIYTLKMVSCNSFLFLWKINQLIESLCSFIALKKVIYTLVILTQTWYKHFWEMKKNDYPVDNHCTAVNVPSKWNSLQLRIKNWIYAYAHARCRVAITIIVVGYGMATRD